MIYFDNAATTYPKPKSVIRALTDCVSQYCANPGRSSHRLSIKTSEKVYEAREKIADFIGAVNPESIVFTQNATHALNIAIKTTVEPKSHVIISNLEHNSVFRPVYALSLENGVEYSVFDSSVDIEASIESLIRDNTRCIISTLASNVTGREIPLERLSKIAKKHRLKLIVDASQYIGHKPIDLRNTYCDILCAPGHKALFGIQGSGFISILDGMKRKTLFEGGSGNDSKNPVMPELLPERFEAGTLSSPSIISLSAGIDFINSIGLSEIENKITNLTERCAEAIHSIKNSVLYEYGNGVISFNISGVPAELISGELNRHGVCTRSGLHCAPLAHNSIGTLNIGTVRLSFSYLNKMREIDEFYRALRSVSQKYE